MFVQIFASSACTGVVWTISVPKISNSSAAFEPELSPTPPTTHGSVAISSRKWFSAIRSGTCETNRASPTRKPRRGGRGEDQGVARPEDRKQVVDHPAHVRDVDLDVHVRGRVERQDDVVGF